MSTHTLRVLKPEVGKGLAGLSAGLGLCFEESCVYTLVDGHIFFICSSEGRL